MPGPTTLDAMTNGPEGEPVSLDKSGAGEPAEPVPFVDFDPYRFGAPEHPISPEYAVPGYVPSVPPTVGPAGPAPVAPPVPPHLAANPHLTQAPPPYPPQYPYPAPPPYQRQVVKTGAPGKAQAALWLGVASVALFWTSILDVIPIALALVFGFIGMSEAKLRPNRAGYNQAVAGIALALVGAVAALLFSIWAYHKVEPCMDYDVGTSAFQDCVNDQF